MEEIELRLREELLEQARGPQASLKPSDTRSEACWALFCLGALALLCVGSVAAGIFALKSDAVSYAELWLLFAIAAPLTWIGGQLCKALQQLSSKACYVVVILRSNGSKWDRCLMDALVAEIRQSQAFGERAEATIESGDEDDDGKLKWQVVLLPQLAGAQLLLTRRDESWEVEVTLEHKDPQICGRAQEPRRVESGQLCARTASYTEFLCCGLDVTGRAAATLNHRQQGAQSLMMAWLQQILEQFTKQKIGQVEVYELQEDCKDYRPSWELSD